MNLKAKLLTIFGDIRISWWPLWLSYQKGSYYKVSGEDTDYIKNVVKPGDVILRGYDSYLDNKFIPSSTGLTHSGVVYDKNTVIHAVAEGVSHCNLIDFCRCDHIMVLRPKEGVKRAMDRIEGWLGKPYDFEFEDSNEAFYCHELTAKAYIELKPNKVIPYMGFIRFWHMEPKYLAESFIDNPNFEKILEIHPDNKEKQK